MMHESKGQPIENQCTGKIPKYTDREQLKTPKLLTDQLGFQVCRP